MTGVLKGYDQLLNLVLDAVEESPLGGESALRSDHVICAAWTVHACRLIVFFSAELQPQPRSLGLVVLRGPTITLLSPVDGSEEIANPFLAQE